MPIINVVMKTNRLMYALLVVADAKRLAIQLTKLVVVSAIKMGIFPMSLNLRNKKVPHLEEPAA